MLLKAKSLCVEATSPSSWGQLARASVEACLCSAALGLAVVMAGTGHLPTLQLLRALRLRLTLNNKGKGSDMIHYGNHMAISMALGFLFLGGGMYTLGRSNTAIAALLAAVYPVFPEEPRENRYHLQALRHLYALAAEPRSLQPLDVDTKQPATVPLRVVLRGDAAGGEGGDASPAAPATPLQGGATPLALAQLPAQGERGGGGGALQAAPCLLPAAEEVVSLEVCGPRYWPQRVRVPVKGSRAAAGVYVQRRLGFLPYADDPSGTCSVMCTWLCTHIVIAHLSRTEHNHHSGMRSVLSRAFDDALDEHGFDVVSLCATFSADPSMMAFARVWKNERGFQRRATLLPPPSICAALSGMRNRWAQHAGTRFVMRLRATCRPPCRCVWSLRPSWRCVCAQMAHTRNDHTVVLSGQSDWIRGPRARRGRATRQRRRCGRWLRTTAAAWRQRLILYGIITRRMRAKGGSHCCRRWWCKRWLRGCGGPVEIEVFIANVPTLKLHIAATMSPDFNAEVKAEFQSFLKRKHVGDLIQANGKLESLRGTSTVYDALHVRTFAPFRNVRHALHTTWAMHAVVVTLTVSTGFAHPQSAFVPNSRH